MSNIVQVQVLSRAPLLLNPIRQWLSAATPAPLHPKSAQSYRNISPPHQTPDRPRSLLPRSVTFSNRLTALTDATGTATRTCPARRLRRDSAAASIVDPVARPSSTSSTDLPTTSRPARGETVPYMKPIAPVPLPGRGPVPAEAMDCAQSLVHPARRRLLQPSRLSQTRDKVGDRFLHDENVQGQAQFVRHPSGYHHPSARQAKHNIRGYSSVPQVLAQPLTSVFARCKHHHQAPINDSKRQF